MNRMLINAAQAEELRVALVQDRTLYDLIVESAGFEQKVGNVYKAKITSIEPSLDAIFVDYGSDRHGFLPVKEIARHYFHNPPNNPQERVDIKRSLRIGQELMIQVEKEERGNKGAALTTFISLAGSYLVLMPNNPRAGGISRRIEGEDRDELRESLSQIDIPEDMGVIVRTAGVGKSGDELKWDLDVLISHWEAIQRASEERSAPFLIHQEGDIVIRAIRDYLRPDISELILDNKEMYEKAVNHIKLVRPDFVDRVQLYEQQEPLFTHFGIEQQIETAYKRTVHLRSGGSIVIDHTEALVAIDINSAGSTKGENIEQTALNTNLEAAEEIARQLRLRDIGGLVVIDFIDMMQYKHQREVESVLLKSLQLDRARVQISKISRFGMLEMSRQRLRPSLRETIQNVCPTCNGHGSVRSVESIALTVLRIIEEEAMKPNTSEVQVQASVDTATFLLNEKRDFLNHIEQHYQTTVFVVPNPNFQPHNYDIKRLRRVDSESAGSRHKPSYSHLEAPEVDLSTSRQANERRPADQPAVKNIMPSRPEEEGKGNGLFKRLMSSVFGSNDAQIDTEQSASSPRSSTSRQSESSERSRDRDQDKSRGSRSNDRRRSNTRGNQSDNERSNRGRGQQDRRSQSRDNRGRSDSSNRSDNQRNRRSEGNNTANPQNVSDVYTQPDDIGNRIQPEQSGDRRSESRRDDNRRDENRRDDNRRGDGRRGDNRRSDSRRDEGRRDDSRRDSGRGNRSGGQGQRRKPSDNAQSITAQQPDDAFGNQVPPSNKPHQTYTHDAALDEKPISVSLDQSVKAGDASTKATQTTDSSRPVSKAPYADSSMSRDSNVKAPVSDLSDSATQEPLVVRPKSDDSSTQKATAKVVTPPAPKPVTKGVEKTVIQPIMPKPIEPKLDIKEDIVVPSKPQDRFKAPEVQKTPSSSASEKQPEEKTVDVKAEVKTDTKPKSADVKEDVKATSSVPKSAEPSKSTESKRDDSKDVEAKAAASQTSKATETTENEDK